MFVDMWFFCYYQKRINDESNENAEIALMLFHGDGRFYQKY